jgi:hypothetical protein
MMNSSQISNPPWAFTTWVLACLFTMRPSEVFTEMTSGTVKTTRSLLRLLVVAVELPRCVVNSLILSASDVVASRE